jgi:hypothetical protein
MSQIKKAELTKGLSFGSSAIFLQDPPLSVPFSRRVWLYRDNILCFIRSESNYSQTEVLYIPIITIQS